MKSTSTTSTTTTIVATEESLMESPGVSCWDFAYTAGPCALTLSAASTSAAKECVVTKRNSTRKAHTTTTTSSSASSSSPSSPSLALKDSCRRPEESPRSFILSHRHKPKSLKRDNAGSATSTATPALESRTYLLSCPTSRSVTYPHTHTTISTLLSQPRNQIVLLVPQNNIVCPRVCELSRLPRTGGSCIQILPIPEVIGMSYNDNEDAVVAFAESGCESESCRGDVAVTDKELSNMNVAEVVRKIVKYTKARSFDGYLVFEDDRASWQFLERVGKGVKEVCKKKDKDKVKAR